MSWFRTDDTIHHHPKFKQLASKGLYDASFTLWHQMASESSLSSSDGFISHYELKTLSHHSIKKRNRIITALVDVGLIDLVPGGYRIHDYLDYNPSADDVKKRREQAKIRQQRFQRKHKTESKLKSFMSQNERQNDSQISPSVLIISNTYDDNNAAPLPLIYINKKNNIIYPMLEDIKHQDQKGIVEMIDPYTTVGQVLVFARAHKCTITMSDEQEISKNARNLRDLLPISAEELRSAMEICDNKFTSGDKLAYTIGIIRNQRVSPKRTHLAPQPKPSENPKTSELEKEDEYCEEAHIRQVDELLLSLGYSKLPSMAQARRLACLPITLIESIAKSLLEAGGSPNDHESLIRKVFAEMMGDLMKKIA